jgi:Ca-activated chloride channel family protein
VVKGVTTKEIRYLNRNGANNQDTGTSLPGEYYVLVSLSEKEEQPLPFALPMTLTVGAVGTAGTGKPEYVNGAAPVSGASVTPSTTPTEESSQPSGGKTEAGGPVQDSGSGSDDGGTPIGLIAGLGGGGVLLALLGALAILRLRKKPAPAMSGSFQQQYPPQQYPQQPSWQQNPNQTPPQPPHHGPGSNQPPR